MGTISLERLKELQELAHGRDVSELLSELSVSSATGLSAQEAERRLRLYGPNKITSRRKINAFTVLLHQLKSPVVYLLSTAAALALSFGNWKEAIAIAVVLALNTLIGFATEIRAARSMEALRALGTHKVRVRRDGRTRIIPAEELVPGDIAVLEAGDKVAADLRLAEASNLAADESTLTGEFVAVSKSTAPVPLEARISEQTSMLFRGTSLTRGSGVGVAVACGLDTELGRITQLVEEAEPESSPLERKVARLSAQLLWITLLLTALIVGLGLATGKDAYIMVEAGIALAVAAIPEGLPIVATLTLARSMWRMAKRNALIERLSAVETLGATTVILTDKTGTLTENRMTVRKVWLPLGEVEADYAARASEVTGQHIYHDPQLRHLLKAAVLCNGATLGLGKSENSGDPMELALLRAGRAAGLEQPSLLRSHPEVRKYAFDSSTKMMATVHRRDDRYHYFIKGAPEAVLAAARGAAAGDAHLPLDAAARTDWQRRVETFGHRGLRVLACATKDSAADDAPPFEDLTFLGLIGLEDPARADVPQAIKACQQAGIRVIMATGDHAVTARAIGEAVGLRGDSPPLEGRELLQLAQDDAKLFATGIFARVSPAEKLKLVRAYQSAGEIVAMTGDGVNDAPALRQADIGIAMGLRGTDVAREAADMVLLDDAFPTIVRSIREGRVIFGNIRRFVAYLLSCNLAEVLVVALAILATLPLPILPLQILFLNLVTDVFPAFALAMGEGEHGIMKRPPRDPDEPILGRKHWLTIAGQSLALTAGTFGALFFARFWLHLDSGAVITVTFLTLAFGQLWHVFNMRSARSDLWRNEITRSPWVWASLVLCSALLVIAVYLPPLAQVLGLVRPNLTMWTVVLFMSLAPLIAWQAGIVLLKGSSTVLRA